MHSTSIDQPEVQTRQKPALLPFTITEHAAQQRQCTKEGTQKQSQKPSLFAQAMAGVSKAATGKPFTLDRYASRRTPEKHLTDSSLRASTHSSGKQRSAVTEEREEQWDTTLGSDMHTYVGGLSYSGMAGADHMPFCSVEDIQFLCRSSNDTQREYGLRMLQNTVILQRTQASDQYTSPLRALLRFPADPYECSSSAGHILLLNLKDSIEQGNLSLLNTVLAAFVTVLIADEGFVSEQLHVSAALLGQTASSIAFPVTPFMTQLMKLGFLRLIVQALDLLSDVVDLSESLRIKIESNIYLLVERVLIGSCFTAAEWNKKEGEDDTSVAEDAQALTAHLFNKLIEELDNMMESGEFLRTSSRIALRTFCYDHVLLGYAAKAEDLDTVVAGFEMLVEAFAKQNEAVRPEILSVVTIYYIFLSRLLRGADSLLSIHKTVTEKCASILRCYVPTNAVELNSLLILMNILQSKATVPEQYMDMTVQTFESMIDWRLPEAQGGFSLPQRCTSAYAPFLAFSILQCQSSINNDLYTDCITAFMKSLEVVPPNCTLVTWSDAAIAIHQQEGALLCTVTNTGVALIQVIAALATTLRNAVPFASSLSSTIKKHLHKVPPEYHFVFMFPLAHFLTPRSAIEAGLYPNSAVLHTLQVISEYPKYGTIGDSMLVSINTQCSVPALAVLHAVCCLASPEMRVDGDWRHMVIRMALIYINELSEMDTDVRKRALTYIILCIVCAATGLCSVSSELAADMQRALHNLFTHLSAITTGDGYELLYATPDGEIKQLAAVTTAFAKSIVEGGTMNCMVPLLYVTLLHPSVTLDTSVRTELWSNLSLARINFSELEDHFVSSIVETNSSVILACLSCYEHKHETYLIRHVLERYIKDNSSKMSEKIIIAAIEAVFSE